MADDSVPCISGRELFQDGYDANGDRVYDKIGGLTCHQCRQKTAGKRTVCSCCNSLNVIMPSPTTVSMQISTFTPLPSPTSFPPPTPFPNHCTPLL